MLEFLPCNIIESVLVSTLSRTLAFLPKLISETVEEVSLSVLKFLVKLSRVPYLTNSLSLFSKYFSFLRASFITSVATAISYPAEPCNSLPSL